MQESQKNHLWRYILVTFALSTIVILSFLTYRNFGLLKAEISAIISSKVSENVVSGSIDISKENLSTVGTKVINSPIIHIKFDESGNSTSFIDASGNGNNASCTNPSCPTAGIAGRIGTAVSFDGSDDYLDIPSNISIKPKDQLTVSMWISPNSSAQNQAFQTLFLNPYNHAIRLMPNGMIRGEIYNETLTKTVYISSKANVISYNSWNHIVMSYDGSNIKLYINGQLVNTIASIGQLGTVNTNPILIGKYTNPQKYVGLMDELKMYSTVFNQSDVAKDYNNQISSVIDTSTVIKDTDKSSGAVENITKTIVSDVSIKQEDAISTTGAVKQVNTDNLTLVKDFYIPTDLKAAPGTSILVPIKNGKKIENLTTVFLKFTTKPSTNINNVDLSSPSVFKGETPYSITADVTAGTLLVAFQPLKKNYILGANSTLFNITANLDSNFKEGDKIQISIDSDPDITKSVSHFTAANESYPPTVDPGYITINLCANVKCPINSVCNAGSCSCNKGYTGYPNCTLQQSKQKTGDLNGDGSVTMLDVVALFKIANGSAKPTESQLNSAIQSADMNSDSKITMIDVIIVFNKVIKP